MFPASAETNMLMSSSDSSVPILPVRRTLISDIRLQETSELPNRESKHIYFPFVSTELLVLGREGRRKERLSLKKIYVKNK